jgi:hypothetical protein
MRNAAPWEIRGGVFDGAAGGWFPVAIQITVSYGRKQGEFVEREEKHPFAVANGCFVD